MKTLAIDTSGKTVGIAILNNSEILYEVAVNSGLNHSLVLLNQIDQALNAVNATLFDVDLFAATVGPGSFTGLRIGLSTLKGLALSCKKPLVGVSTLEALAHNICDDHRLICPVLKGPMKEVYAGMYRFQYPAYYTCVMDDRLTDVDSLICEIDEPVIFVGDGAIHWQAVLRSKLERGSYIAPESKSLCHASSVAMIGKDKYENGQALDAISITPSYLRVSEAELKRGKD